jgi:hypothetical protein
METKTHEQKVSQLNELKTWLRKRPPVVSAVIASRFGLRVLPFVVDEPTEGRFSARQLRQIISSFRYTAWGRLLAKRPSRALDAVDVALNSVAPRSGSAAKAAIFEAYAAASSLVDAGRGGFFADIPASRAGYAAVIAASVAEYDAFWEPVAADVAWIEAGKEPLDLLERPMGLDRPPPHAAPEPFLSRWSLMRSALEREDKSWKVWTVWYQDRLDGSPSPPDDMEYFRVTLIENAAVKANDTSDEGRRLWQQEVDANMTLLRNSARKANRIVAKYIAGI